MTQTEIDEQAAKLLAPFPGTYSQVWNELDIEKRLAALGLPPTELIHYLNSCLGRSAPFALEEADTTAFSLFGDYINNRIDSTNQHTFISGANVTAPPIEDVRNTVARHATRLSKQFGDLTARLPESILLKEALRRLEHEAARYDYEPLSRIAAILHNVLALQCYRSV